MFLLANIAAFKLLLLLFADLKSVFVEFTKGETINLTENSSFPSSPKTSWWWIQRSYSFLHITYYIDVRHCEPFFQLFETHFLLNLICCTVRSFSCPLSAATSLVRENALKRRAFFFLPENRWWSSVYTNPAGINPCVGPVTTPPSRFLQLTPPDEVDRSAPPHHAFCGNQPPALLRTWWSTLAGERLASVAGTGVLWPRRVLNQPWEPARSASKS